MSIDSVEYRELQADYRAMAFANQDLQKLNAELVEALEAAEARDESIHSFADLECYVNDSETHSEYFKEFTRRRKQRAALAKAKNPV